MPARLSHSTATQASNASTTERHTQPAQFMVAGTESKDCKYDLLLLTVPTPGWIMEEGCSGPPKACVLKAWCPDGRIRGYCRLPKGGSQLIVGSPKDECRKLAPPSPQWVHRANNLLFYVLPPWHTGLNMDTKQQSPDLGLKFPEARMKSNLFLFMIVSHLPSSEHEAE